MAVACGLNGARYRCDGTDRNTEARHVNRPHHVRQHGLVLSLTIPVADSGFLACEYQKRVRRLRVTRVAMPDTVLS